MFSKLKQTLILLCAFSTAALTGCGIIVGEDPPPVPEISAGINMNTSCFADGLVTLKNFVEGTSKDSQVVNFWDCYSNAVFEFEKNTHGKDAQKYSSKELANFVQQNFLEKGTKISPYLLHQIFLLKKVFVGGPVDSITRREMFKAIEVMKELKKVTLGLNPFMKIYSLKWQTEGLSDSEKLETFARADKNMIEQSSVVAKTMLEPYDLKELITLAEEIDRFSQPKEETNDQVFTKIAKRFVPIVVPAKNIVLHETGSVVSKWPDFMKTVSDIYSRYAYFHYFVEPNSMFSGVGLDATNQLVQDILKFVENTLNRKEVAGRVDLAQFHNLWVGVVNARVFGDKVTVPSLDRITMALVNRVFIAPEYRAMNKLPYGVVQATVDFMRSDWRIWFETQKWLDQQFVGVDPVIGKNPQELSQAAIRAPRSTGMDELQILLKMPEALSFNRAGRLYLGNDQLNYFFPTANLMNAARSFVRAAIRGYAETPRALSNGGFNEAEADVIFADFRGLFTELEFLDPKDSKFAKDRFRDANLFTPVSDGNEVVTFGEAADLFMMLASGIKSDDSYNSILKSKCFIDKRPSFPGDWLVDVACAMPVYKAQLPAEVTPMPELLSFMRSLSAKDYDLAVFDLIRASGYQGDRSGKVELKFLALFPQISQYVETVFQRFDTNHDGFFNTEEALRAWPLLQKTIKKFPGLNSDEEYKQAFGYMLVEGHPPNEHDAFDKLNFWWNWINPLGFKPTSEWNVHADRQKIIQILGYLSKAGVK